MNDNNNSNFSNDDNLMNDSQQVSSYSNRDDNDITDQLQPDNVILGNTSSIVTEMDEDQQPGSDVLDLTHPSQATHNAATDDDDTDNFPAERIGYQPSIEDEADLQLAGDRNTQFRDIRTTEMLDSKTRLHPEDAQGIRAGFNLDDKKKKKKKNQQNGTLVVDRTIDSQEYDDQDYSMRDDGDDGRGGDGRAEEDSPRDKSQYEVNDKAIDTPGELVNE